MITFALPKGRIFDEIVPLLKAAGIAVAEDPEGVYAGSAGGRRASSRNGSGRG